MISQIHSDWKKDVVCKERICGEIDKGLLDPPECPMEEEIIGLIAVMAGEPKSYRIRRDDNHYGVNHDDEEALSAYLSKKETLFLSNIRVPIYTRIDLFLAFLGWCLHVTTSQQTVDNWHVWPLSDIMTIVFT
jgi:hypothetical protein